MSGKLPILKPRDVESILRKLGFHFVEQKGSHAFWEHSDGRFTAVPHHGGEEIGRGLMRKILGEVKLSPEEFEKLL